MEDELFERPLYRRFAGLQGAGPMPDEKTILRFRHLLDKHQLTPQLLAAVNPGLRYRRVARVAPQGRPAR